MPTHTPGPWSIVGVPTKYPEVVTANGPTSICILRRGGQAEADGQLGANARLIAAAPDLYAALQAMVERYLMETPRHSGWAADALIMRAQAALEKAAGQPR